MEFIYIMKNSLHPYSRPLALIFSNGSLVVDKYFVVDHLHLFFLSNLNGHIFFSFQPDSLSKIDNLFMQLLSAPHKIFCHSSSLLLFQFFLLHSSHSGSLSSSSSFEIKGFSSSSLSRGFRHSLTSSDKKLTNFPFLVLDVDTFTNSFWYGSFGFATPSFERFSDDALSKFKKRYGATLGYSS
jgi:hypothetical protein